MLEVTMLYRITSVFNQRNLLFKVLLERQARLEEIEAMEAEAIEMAMAGQKIYF